MEDIFLFLIIFCAIQLFALPAFKLLDYNNKETNKKLIRLGKKKYFFIKYKENPEYISKNSFVFQIINYLLSFLFCLLLIFNSIFNSPTLFLITISIYLSYLAFSIILLIYTGIVSLFIDEKNKK